MSRVTRVCCLSLFAALVLAACGSDATSSSTTTAAGSTTTNVSAVAADLTFTEPGKPINVRVGDRFAIALDAQPSTGFDWTLAAPLAAKVVAPDGTAFTSSLPEPIGGHGTETLYFAATGTGSQSIKLQYSQPWDKTTPPYDTATFTVKVVAATK